MEITRTADTDTTTWAAVIDGTEVAWLSVWTANREISSVETRTAHQRQGLATALYHHATTEAPVFHTIATHRTPEGDAFMRSVGGDEADDALVIDDCCCDHCDA